MKFLIHKRQGYWHNKGALKRYQDELTDGSYSVEIKKANFRSLPQNSYYWGVVVELVYESLKSAGFDAVRSKDDAHEILKALFLKVKDEKNGIVIERIKSTTELNKQEFGEYIDAITVWAFDYLNVTIPAPNQQLIFAEYDNDLNATIISK